MKEAIRQRALELGFDDCHFTSAAPPESVLHFRRWLTEGRHGEMGYLERNAGKRIDPQQLLPGARSVITLAASYHSLNCRGGLPEGAFHAGAVPIEDGANWRPRTENGRCGLVARYARYRDYHDVLGTRLKQLADFIAERSGEGIRSIWCVDTGPVLERDFAQRAGLGFIGKHTNLISRRLGNWIFLSEVITTLELAPDRPERNYCGKCSRCISACPTGAIKAPFQLDARLCISYLTIELKGPIPVELRSAVGNRIYGCDDCLAVCPWNRFAREGRLMKAHAQPELTTPDLLELLALDEAAFKRRFSGTAMLRTKRRGLLRNMCVALGNAGDETALPALQKAATESEPLIAEHARWAIERLRKKAG